MKQQPYSLALTVKRINMLSVELAGIALYSLVFVFSILHILALAELAPASFIWAGNNNSNLNALNAEFVSIGLFLSALVLATLKTGYLVPLQNSSSVNMGLWLLVVAFSINTIFNLKSNNPIKTYGFSLVTLTMSFLSLQLAIQ